MVTEIPRLEKGSRTHAHDAGADDGDVSLAAAHIRALIAVVSWHGLFRRRG